MSQITRLIELIQRVCPDLEVQSAHLEEGGQYNSVLIVNDGWIFRFARFAESAKTLQRETVILAAIQSHITLAIPSPVYQSLAAEHPEENFVGYRMIPGTPLWQENLNQITDEHIKQHLAEQLAQFLKQLHSIPVDMVIPESLPIEDSPAYWTALYERFQQKLFPYMRIDAKTEVSRQFESFLHTPAEYSYKPVLRHGDFGGGNVIADLETGTITGIIDFGATTLGDPAIDFGGLSTFGEDFFQHCLRVYPEIEDARKRMAFYQSTFALQEALYGIEHDVPVAFAAGIADYQ